LEPDEASTFFSSNMVGDGSTIWLYSWFKGGSTQMFSFTKKQRSGAGLRWWLLKTVQGRVGTSVVKVGRLVKEVSEASKIHALSGSEVRLS
ncbi:hypothetical protein U1Q18_023026, partial [Sarracenia purpurea var. burkii]